MSIQFPTAAPAAFTSQSGGKAEAESATGCDSSTPLILLGDGVCAAASSRSRLSGWMMQGVGLVFLVAAAALVGCILHPNIDEDHYTAVGCYESGAATCREINWPIAPLRLSPHACRHQGSTTHCPNYTQYRSGLPRDIGVQSKALLRP